MAKHQPKAPVAPRAVRTKTAAQLDERNRNIEAARLRLEKLQAKQKLARQLRERHPELGGGEDQVIDIYLDYVAVECENEIEAAYVKAAFTSQKWVVMRLWNFLAGREPSYAVVKRFFAKGLPFGPATVKEAA